jgi:hypothetical protein
VYKEIDKDGDVSAICFKPLSCPYREDDLRQMGKWRDHFVQTVNDTMSFVTEQQDMIKSYHTFFPGYNGTIPNDAKENMIDLQEKLESQVTECTAKLGEIKGGLITIFRGIDLSIVEVSFFEKINKVLWIIGKIMRFFNNPQSIFPETLQSTLSTKIDHTIPLTRLIINETMYMMMVGKNEMSFLNRNWYRFVTFGHSFFRAQVIDVVLLALGIFGIVLGCIGVILQFIGKPGSRVRFQVPKRSNQSRSRSIPRVAQVELTESEVMPTRQPIINETVIQLCQACTHCNRTVQRNQIRYSNNAPSGRIVHRCTKMSSVPLYLAESDLSD